MNFTCIHTYSLRTPTLVVGVKVFRTYVSVQSFTCFVVVPVWTTAVVVLLALFSAAAWDSQRFKSPPLSDYSAATVIAFAVVVSIEPGSSIQSH